jgi:hypothetical protein
MTGGLRLRKEDLQCLQKLAETQPPMRVRLLPPFSLSRLIAMGLVASYADRIDITAKGEATLERG